MVKRLNRNEGRGCDHRRSSEVGARRWCLLAALGAAVALLLLVWLPVSADTVPVGGCLSGSVSGWYFTAGGNETYSANGHGTCGAMGNAYGGWHISQPVVLTGVSSTLTVWGKTANSGTSLSAYARSWDSGVRSQVGGSVVLSTTTWISYTWDYTSYVGNYSIELYCSNGCQVSDISLSGANNTTFNAYGLNNSAAPQQYWTKADGSSVTWSAAVGHNALGSYYQCCSGYYFLRPLTLGSYTQWGAWAYYGGSANFVFTVWDFYTGAETTIYNGTYGMSGWTYFPIDLSAYGNHVIMFKVGTTSPSNLYIDDICPTAGCVYSTPTATSTGAPTSPGYATIDWSQFPTPPPYPTFPPFPTQMPYPTQAPYPTAIYGPGTAIPISGSVSITGVVKIDDRTPVGVKIDDSTPVAVKVDDRTPVRVMFGNGPNYTPVAWNDVGVQQGAPAPGAVLPTLVTSPAQSHIEYGQGGSSANPLNFSMGQADLHLPHLSFPIFNVAFDTVIHYYYPTALSLAGIDMLPAIYGLAAVYVLVTIIRNLQQR